MENFILRWLLLCLIAGLMQTSAAQTDLIIPGGDWRDTNGKQIAATEGGIIKVDSLYYLWGMDCSANNYALWVLTLFFMTLKLTSSIRYQENLPS